MRRVTLGPITAIRLDPLGLDVDGGAFVVADPSLLRGLTVGDYVTVTWEDEGRIRRAVRITRRQLPGSLETLPPHPPRQHQTTCPVCGEGLATSRGVLFQGDHLVHAACWRDDPKLFDAPRPTG